MGLQEVGLARPLQLQLHELPGPYFQGGLIARLDHLVSEGYFSLDDSLSHDFPLQLQPPPRVVLELFVQVDEVDWNALSGGSATAQLIYSIAVVRH